MILIASHVFSGLIWDDEMNGKYEKLAFCLVIVHYKFLDLIAESVQWI